MDAEERKGFEENRANLIDNAWIGYGISLHVDRKTDKVCANYADLGQFVEFYQNYRSEIEEVI